MLKLKLNLLVLVLLFTSQVFGQGINLGPDVNLPACGGCYTIHANAGTGIGETGYNLVQTVGGAVGGTYTPFVLSTATGATNSGINIDDTYSAAFALPFTFYYFGSPRDSFIIGSNGSLSFNSCLALDYNAWSLSGQSPLPNTTFQEARNSIMCPYYDIHPGIGGQILFQTFGTAPNRIFVVSFNNVPLFSCTSLLANQQIALYETTNEIETYIGNKPYCAWNGGGLAIHGIENEAGNVAYTIPGRNVQAFTASNEVWKFAPNGIPTGMPGGYTINWYDEFGSLLASNVDSLVVCATVRTKIYAVAVSTALCPTPLYSDTIIIDKKPPLTMNISNIVEPNCNGGNDGSYSINVSGGQVPYSYTSNGNPVASNVTGVVAGTYTIQVTDADNCTESTVITVNEPPKVQLLLVDKADVLCKYQNNAFVTIDATGGVPGYNFWYNNIAHTTNGDFQYLMAGNYMFYTSDSHNCLDSMAITLTQPDSLLTVSQIAHPATCIIKTDGSVEAIASGGVPNYTYEWNSHPPQYTATATNLETGVYHVVVTDANNCVTATQIQVEQQLCCQLFMPDAFSPNADSKNDTYRMVEYGGGVILGDFRIYNRWGQEVFRTQDITKGWDGKFKGTDQDQGTYNYLIQYQCNDKGIISQKVAKGTLILIR